MTAGVAVAVAAVEVVDVVDEVVGPSAPEAKAPAINTEEFPALPGGKGKTGETSPPVLSPLGRWDDEMEAFDAKMKSDAQA
ncbi:hypothetical protein CGLO_17311 [Colletotrichum gloeosporioides Cg-14]|uniref:Uncharacterized protein n=1 Tax=Colletotrichum gloeosporioides (strain Cg-14) TaxID=1237896 RepID=T0JU03_COLGC|nr:hypothetical protein CGLO_17311 [Colletotrichum gloeosporioides Cg-14]